MDIPPLYETVENLLVPTKTGAVPVTIKEEGKVMVAAFPEARGVAVVKETVIFLLVAVGTLSTSAMKKLTPETRPPRGPEGNVPIWSVGRGVCQCEY
jgi:hypothetical protein